MNITTGMRIIKRDKLYYLYDDRGYILLRTTSRRICQYYYKKGKVTVKKV